jgi:TonB family protein
MNTITVDGGANRRFVLPAAIVLSAHAALFLGFTGNPAMSQLNPTRPPDPASTTIDVPLTGEITEQKGDDPSHNNSTQQQRPEILNPVSYERPDMPGIPVTPNLPYSTVGLPGPWSPTSGPGNPTSPGRPPVNPDMLDHTPEAVRQPQPIYPLEARQAGESGEVVVTFVVDESGHVMNPHVVSSTDPIFEEPTVQAIGLWRFAPGTLHGVPVRFRMSVPVAFHLDS